MEIRLVPVLVSSYIDYLAGHVAHGIFMLPLTRTGCSIWGGPWSIDGQRLQASMDDGNVCARARVFDDLMLPQQA